MDLLKGLSPEDKVLVHAITERMESAKLPSVRVDELLYSLCAVHGSTCPMDLSKLHNATDDTFWHDLNGIDKYRSRKDNKLMLCFLPRCHA